MQEQSAIQLFEGLQIRVIWDDEQEKYYFSIVDVIQVLTESVDGRKYWNKLKQRLKEEGNETVTNCHQLKMPASDGKLRLTDVADTATTEFAKQKNPKGLNANKQVAQQGGEAARVARENIEQGLGRSIISPDKARDHIRPIEEAKAQELPFDSEEQ